MNDVIAHTRHALSKCPDAIKEVVRIELLGAHDIPALIRISVWVELDDVLVTVRAIVGIVGGRFHIEVDERVRGPRREELVALMTALLDAELLLVALEWAEGWLPEWRINRRGAALVRALSEAAERQNAQAVKSWADFIRMLANSIELFQEVRLQNQAFADRYNHGLGVVMPPEAGGADNLLQLPQRPGSSIDGELRTVLREALRDASDSRERFDHLATEAWLRMAGGVMAQFESTRVVEEKMMREVLASFGMILGHHVGTTVLAGAAKDVPPKD